MYFDDCLQLDRQDNIQNAQSFECVLVDGVRYWRITKGGMGNGGGGDDE